MIQLKASKGLGDAIYLRAIAIHLIERGEKLEVFTPWRQVFDDLPLAVRGLGEITGDEDWRYGKACLHCRILNAPDLFSMACLQAGITEPVILRMNWQARNHELVDSIRRESRGLPIFVFQPLKVCTNLNERLMRPQAEAFARVVAEHGDHFRVMLGHPAHVQDMNLACEMNLVGRTSVTDVFDVGTIGDKFFGEPCYVTVMAEALGKPYACMFSRKGIESGRTFVSNLKPERFFHKPHLATAIFDEEACAS